MKSRATMNSGRLDTVTKILLTASQVAMRLGVSRQQVWRLTNAGVLPAYRAGRNFRFCMDEVLVALRKRNNESAVGLA